MSNVKIGNIGERAAEAFFLRAGWCMFRTQPATKVVMINRMPRIINCGSGGISDYTGYHVSGMFQFYTACEVKTAPVDAITLPYSKVRDEQHDFLDKIFHAYVGIYWQGKCEFEIFQLALSARKGSYKYGMGIRRETILPTTKRGKK